MIIENRQGMAATPAKREVALEIHLPKMIGDASLESLPGSVLDALLRIQATVAS
jgi:hypothetical protein